MSDTPKLCLICGINANKIAKYDRYNFAPTFKKKNQAAEESSSDSDEPVSNSKSKKKEKAPLKRIPKAQPPIAVSSRQTRNKNPKTFAVSLCKVMELPHTPEHPFLQIFSQADYCGSCMGKIKDIHASQTEMEKIRERLSEARVDIELDLSKHLQTIPFCKNVRRDLAYERYEEDINQILDYHGADKKKKPKEEANSEPEPKRKRRQAAVNSEEKMKKKADEDAENEAEEKKVSKQEADPDFEMEDSTSEMEGTNAENANGSVVVVDLGEEQDDDDLPAGELKEAVVVLEEVKAPIIVKVKRDPNLKCPHCPIPRYFNIAESLEEHVTRVHKNRKKFACDLCDKTFHSQKELQTHKSKAHDVSLGAGAVGWTCGFCDVDFQQKRYLEDHLDLHEEAKPLNCQFCGRGFKRRESLQKAFQIYKGQTVDPCGQCGRNLNLKDYLEHNRRLKDK